MLKRETCEACRAGAPPVPESERSDLMKEIPLWELTVTEGADCLVRVYKFSNFVEALAFTNRLGELAESVQHHPRIVVEWGKVEVSWWTHKINGLHRNDFIMAARTDALLEISK